MDLQMLIGMSISDCLLSSLIEPTGSMERATEECPACFNLENPADSVAVSSQSMMLMAWETEDQPGLWVPSNRRNGY